MFPVRLHNNSKNYVKNSVRKGLYVCLGIYGLIFIALVIPIIITQSDELAMQLMLPFCALSLICLPLGLKFVKSKEIAFFTKYLDFKPTNNFQPSDEAFGDYVQCVFSPDGLIVKSGYDDEFIVPYSILDFLAWPAYKGMGDMMTIYISINLKPNIRYGESGLSDASDTNLISHGVKELDGGKSKDIIPATSEVGFADSFIDPKIEDLFSPAPLRLNQTLYDYLIHYNIPAKNLHLLIANRNKLMKDNCKFFN